MIRKTSVRCNIQEDIVAKVVSHQWGSIRHRMNAGQGHDQATISATGFLTFSIMGYRMLYIIDKAGDAMKTHETEEGGVSPYKREELCLKALDAIDRLENLTYGVIEEHTKKRYQELRPYFVRHLAISQKDLLERKNSNGASKDLQE